MKQLFVLFAVATVNISMYTEHAHHINDNPKQTASDQKSSKHFYQEILKPKFSITSYPTVPVDSGMFSPIKGTIRSVIPNLFLKRTVLKYLSTRFGGIIIGGRQFSLMPSIVSVFIQPFYRFITTVKSDCTAAAKASMPDMSQFNIFDYFAANPHGRHAADAQKFAQDAFYNTQKSVWATFMVKRNEMIASYVQIIQQLDIEQCLELLKYTILSQFALRMQFIETEMMSMSIGIQGTAYMAGFHEPIVKFMQQEQLAMYTSYTAGLYIKGKIAFIDFMLFIHPAHFAYTRCYTDVKAQSGIFSFICKNPNIKRDVTLAFIFVPSWSLVLKFNTSGIVFADTYLKISQHDFDHSIEISLEFITPESLGI